MVAVRIVEVELREMGLVDVRKLELVEVWEVDKVEVWEVGGAEEWELDFIEGEEGLFDELELGDELLAVPEVDVAEREVVGLAVGLDSDEFIP